MKSLSTVILWGKTAFRALKTTQKKRWLHSERKHKVQITWREQDVGQLWDALAWMDSYDHCSPFSLSNRPDTIELQLPQETCVDLVSISNCLHFLFSFPAQTSHFSMLCDYLCRLIYHRFHWSVCRQSIRKELILFYSTLLLTCLCQGHCAQYLSGPRAEMVLWE